MAKAFNQMVAEQVRLTWHGCAHYHIEYKDIKIIIDPLIHAQPVTNRIYQQRKMISMN